MFHQGDLQSGIITALQQGKSVVCFVRDNGDESDEWENDWLKDSNIPQSLQQHAVALRLETGSQEAAFLSAFCPVTAVPAVIVIYQGQLVEQLNSGVTKDDFVLRLQQAVNRTSTSNQGLQSVPGAISSQGTEPSQETQPPPPPPIEPQPHPATPQPPNQPAIPALFADRAARLEAQQKAKEAAAKAERLKAARRQKDAAAAAEATSRSSTSSPRSAQQVSYQQQQVNRKREAKEERDRILRRVEADKLERKAREERRRAQAQAGRGSGASGTLGAGDVVSSTPLIPLSTAGANNPRCALQARLLDGSTMRTSFPSSATLASAVRPWIDNSLSPTSTPAQPYTFKQILAPLPSRPLSASEETQPLSDLGLPPSATLILVPIPATASSAYTFGARAEDSPVTGAIGSVMSAVVGAVYTVLGLGQADAVQLPPTTTREAVGGEEAEVEQDGGVSGISSASAVSAAGTSGGGGVRIRTLRDQRAEVGEQQLYNGNQLNFEPKPKEGEEADKDV